MVIGWLDITLCAITHEYKFTNAKHPWFNQLVNITHISYGETLHLAAMQKYKVYIFGPSITCTKYQLVIAYKTDLKTAKLSVLFQNQQSTHSYMLVTTNKIGRFLHFMLCTRLVGGFHGVHTFSNLDKLLTTISKDTCNIYWV